MAKNQQEKYCKRKKCSFYNFITVKCKSCEWNPEAVWTERKEGGK